MNTRRDFVISGATVGAAAILPSRLAAASELAVAEKSLAARNPIMAQNERRSNTFDNPYIISDPTLAFVNLAGGAGQSLMAQDRGSLDDIFKSRIQIADRTLPRCNVLFLYCALDASGLVTGTSFTFRDLIKRAGAHVAVIASDIQPALLQNPEFGKAISANQKDWPANIVITLNRNGDHFGRFFHQLFAQMRAGVSMPMAWVKLAPQGPHQASDIPGTICLMEAGHIAFGPQRS